MLTLPAVAAANRTRLPLQQKRQQLSRFSPKFEEAQGLVGLVLRRLRAHFSEPAKAFTPAIC